MFAVSDWIVFGRIGVVAASVALLLAAACADLLFRTIPNCICIALAGIGLLSRGAAGLAALGVSAAVAILLFLLLVWVHSRGHLGGGDVKLIPAVALGLSPLGIYQMLTWMALAGGGLVLLHWVMRLTPRPTRRPAGTSWAKRIWTIEKWRWRKPDCLPYGVAIACGGIQALLSGTGT